MKRWTLRYRLVRAASAIALAAALALPALHSPISHNPSAGAGATGDVAFETGAAGHAAEAGCGWCLARTQLRSFAGARPPGLPGAGSAALRLAEGRGVVRASAPVLGGSGSRAPPSFS